MVDIGFRIVVAQSDLCGKECCGVGLLWSMNRTGRKFVQFRNESSHISSIRVESISLTRRIKNPKIGSCIGTASPAHCHPRVLEARSASTSVSQNQRAPSFHEIRRSFTRKLATIIRTRLCIHPVCQSCRMPASTIGNPVRPRCQARSPTGSTRHGKFSYEQRSGASDV